ncbi:MAG: hypothetical protein COT85_01600 [Chlamydiae bacterium CG10_big_fil_rev_8_21_14_0_10_42_34]|nr:MAG: hypothetical protein COT85_01600 [Chlamydiae bacterium CG10_big_fil_rev_8_21_14_0_10_42_34]
MIRFILSVLVAACLSTIALIRTDGFSPSILVRPSSLIQSDDVPIEVQTALCQPYRYLSKGRQCFVFESEDGKYVLKFFNHKYLKMPWYSFFAEEKERAKRSLRHHFYENSYEIAQREFGDEIFYLHLGKGAQLPKICITDKASRDYDLDLSQLSFVLQRKGLAFYPVLSAIYEREGIEGLCREIDSFIEIVQRRISKNIADGDQDVEHNWGYVEGRIFHLDPGRLYYKGPFDPKRQREEWVRSTHNFHKWLSKHYPEAAQYFERASALKKDFSDSVR